MSHGLAWDTALRILALCVLLAGAETLHGIARTVWAVPRWGKERALQRSALTGSLLAGAICWFMVPGLGLHTACAPCRARPGVGDLHGPV